MTKAFVRTAGGGSPARFETPAATFDLRESPGGGPPSRTVTIEYSLRIKAQAAGGWPDLRRGSLCHGRCRQSAGLRVGGNNHGVTPLRPAVGRVQQPRHLRHAEDTTPYHRIAVDGSWRTVQGRWRVISRLFPYAHSTHHQPISLSMTRTTAGSSGKSTGSSFVRTVRSPALRARTFTGQPHVL